LKKRRYDTTYGCRSSKTMMNLTMSRLMKKLKTMVHFNKLLSMATPGVAHNLQASRIEGAL
jgi:hypothetical protein